MTPSQRARFFRSLRLVDARILAETEEDRNQKSKKRKYETATTFPFEIDEFKGTIESCPCKTGAVSTGFSADSNHEAHCTVNEFVQGQTLSMQPLPVRKFLEVVKCPNGKITHDLSEVERNEKKAFSAGSNDGDKEHCLGKFSMDERWPMHHDSVVASLNGAKSTHIDDGEFRIKENVETRVPKSTLDLNKIRSAKGQDHGKWNQEEMQRSCMPIRDHGTMEEIKSLLFEPGKVISGFYGINKTGLEEVIARTSHPDAILTADEIEKSASDNSEPMAMRLLHVDSAAGLSESSDLSSSPLWIKGTTSVAMGTNPLFDSFLSARSTDDHFGSQMAAEKLLHLQNDCREVPKINGCIHPCTDLDDDISTYSMEEEASDLDDLQMLCATLSLDRDLLIKSFPPDKHLCQKGIFPHAADEKNSTGLQTFTSESRFFTNVAQIQAQKSMSEREAIDAWIHHFATLQTEPFRLAVLLIAKASMGRSLPNGAKNDDLVFPTIGKEYLNCKPSSEI